MRVFEVHHTDDLVATQQMRGAMHFPEDPQNAKLVAAIGVAQEIASAERMGSAEAVRRGIGFLQELGGFDLLVHALPPNPPLDVLRQEIRGRTAGAILGWLLAFGSNPRRREQASVRRAIAALEKAWGEKPQSVCGQRAPASRRAIKDAWGSHGAVAHLWLAQWRAENSEDLVPRFRVVAGFAVSIIKIAEGDVRLRDWAVKALRPEPEPPALSYEPPTTKDAKLIVSLRGYTRTE